jgi:hypothetical protein
MTDFAILQTPELFALYANDALVLCQTYITPREIFELLHCEKVQFIGEVYLDFEYNPPEYILDIEIPYEGRTLNFYEYLEKTRG